MKYLRIIFFLLAIWSAGNAIGQDSTGIGGTPYKEMAGGQNAGYLFQEWYPGTVRTSDDQVHDGVQLRYDFAKDEIEYKGDSGLYRVSSGVKEFTIPTGTDLYIFQSGYPAIAGQTKKSFYRVLYDGTTRLLKKYTSPITVEKASATKEIDQGAKLYILKNEKLNEVQLNNKNSFLKLLTDEKNKLNYVIKEQQLEFDGDDDLVRLLEEYDSYKAGRGGN